MDTVVYEYSYSIRWIFDEKDLHEIDSRTLLKSEEAITSLIYSIARDFNFPIEIKVRAREQGSFDISHVVTFLGEHKDVIMILLGAVINKFFSPNLTPKNSNIEKATFMSECFKRINEGNLTESQANTLIDNFGFTRKQKNAFYKANKKDTSIKEIEIKQIDRVIAKIPRETFDDYICLNNNEDKLISDAKIYIISPVIVAGSNEGWTGEYESEKIRFYIKDKEFLEKSQNKVISFNTGFYIKCELKKIVKIQEGTEKIRWEVISVSSYGTDEKHEFEFKHRVRRTEILDGQLSLFGDE